MEIGIYTFAKLRTDPRTANGITAGERLRHVIEKITFAEIKLDLFGVAATDVAERGAVRP